MSTPIQATQPKSDNPDQATVKPTPTPTPINVSGSDTPGDAKPMTKVPRKGMTVGVIVALVFLLIGVIFSLVNVFRPCGLFGLQDGFSPFLKFFIWVIFWPAGMFCWGKKLPTHVIVDAPTSNSTSANLAMFLDGMDVYNE